MVTDSSLAGPAGFEPATFGSPLNDRGPTLLSVLSYGPSIAPRITSVKCLRSQRYRELKTLENKISRVLGQFCDEQSLLDSRPIL